MKSFAELKSNKKFIAIAGTLLVASIFFFDNPDDNYDTMENIHEDYINEPYTYQEFSSQPTASPESNYSSMNDDEKVVIYDKGLQMPISTMYIPEGWKLVQDIAFDPNTARPINFKLDLYGPNGEIGNGYMQMFPFGWNQNKNWEQAFQEATRYALGNHLERVSVGQVRRSEKLMQSEDFQKTSSTLRAQNGMADALEVEVNGQRNGQAYKGLITFIKGIQNHAMGQSGFLIPTGIFMSPAEHFEASQAVIESIDKKTIKNPEHEQLLAQINQRAIQQIEMNGRRRSEIAAAQHNQRMQQRWDAFNNSQQNIANMNNIRDANHANYINNLRSSGSMYGSEYNGQDAFIDQIHERSTFNDPWSGQERHMDGQYDYNYTNGLGDYYRTNDPSFDPNSLPGDYQQIDPLH